MRRIKMSIPWIKITIYHLPIVVLFLYIVYGSLGGITYKIIHTSICATDALFMAGWLLAGERKEIKKSYRYLAIICLVAVSMGQCAFTIGYDQLKIFFLMMYIVCSMLFFIKHLVDDIAD